MKIYDSRQRKKLEFVPIKEGEIGMYVCGPTVYDVSHLGHGRSAVAFDVIRRYFEYKGYKVNFVSNYTDVDDKMIKRAGEEGISVNELVDKIVPEYEKDYRNLAIKKPSILPRATGHIKEMIDIIKNLEEKGYTYILDDGVYFDIDKFERYGEFSGQNLDQLKMGARVEVKESKKNPYDFALWKFKKKGEPFWPSPWGEGRPGWHIECSAMSFRHLGEKFDIHGGGLDLLFPHHECEVAQSEGAFGKGSFAKYWIHNGFINVDNEKMSKSLGNFFTLKDVFKKYEPQVVRYMFLQTHYRSPINFSDKLLDQAKASLERIHDFVRNLGIGYKELSGDKKINTDVYREKFEDFMDNDFDVPGALGVLFEVIKSVNCMKESGEISKNDIDLIEEFLRNIDSVLEIIFYKEEALDEEINMMIKVREKAREEKDFKKSDEIRDKLLSKGIILEDTKDGTIWKRV